MYFLLAAITCYAFAMMGGRVARVGVTLGLLIHATFIVRRGLLLGWLPLTERLDILSLIAFIMMLIFLIMKQRQPLRQTEYFTVPIAAFFALMAVLQEQVNAVDVFMQSPWFYLYSAFMTLSYALMGVGTSYGLMYVFGETDDNSLEAQQHGWTLYGWLSLAIGLMFGSVWFYLAYASYWYWTAREFWLSLTWLFYGGVYLHARYLKSFHGRPAALLGVLGFPLMLFNYFGIGTIIKSPWSQF